MCAFARRHQAPAGAVLPAEHGPPTDPALIDAYRYLQVTVGVIAVALPIVTVLGAQIVDGGELKRTISDYYYSRMGAYFVGSMCVLGVIFRSYRRKPSPQYKPDNVLTNVAGLLAVVVGLIPTSTDGTPPAWSWSGVAKSVHNTSAAALLLILAYLSLCRFTLGSRQPPWETRVYRWCGWVMVAALGAFVLASNLELESWINLSAESIAVIAFGVSWIVKSERIQSIIEQRAARE
jgi:hypothetical protein